MRVVAVGRAVVSALLLVVAAVLVPATTSAWWLRTTVSDTDHFVATVAPLADDPVVQDAVADQLTAQTMGGLRETGRLPAAAERRLEPRVHALATRVVAGNAFASAWRDVNVSAHRRLIAVLDGQAGDGGVRLELAVLAETLRQSLVENGVALAQRVPQVQASIPLADADDVRRVRGLYDLLDSGARWLLLLALVCPAAGIALARRRRRALAAWLLGSAVASLVALVGLQVAIHEVVAALPGQGAVARAVLGVLTSRLTWLLGAWSVVLVVAAGATRLSRSRTAA